MMLFRPYIQPILVSLAAFPFLAALITIPFAVRNYRKLGGVPVLKTVIFYSFVLYMLCAFLLTLLPLPDRDVVAVSTPVQPCYIPSHNLMEGLRGHGFDGSLKSLFSGGTLAEYLSSNQFFQIFANIIMLIPEGIYLRYYFGCSLGKTVFYCFLTSLFFEFTQFTGLYGIYAHAFRCADVNDLLTNTLGGLLGFWAAPLLTRFLPTREKLNIVSHAERVSVIREGFAVVIDALIFFVIMFFMALFPLGEWYFRILFLLFAAYFGPLQLLLGGRTVGKLLVRIRVVPEEGKGKALLRYWIRALFFVLGYPIMGLADIVLILYAALSFVSDSSAVVRLVTVFVSAVASVVSLGVIVYCRRRSGRLPHNHFAGLRMISEIGNT